MVHTCDEHKHERVQQTHPSSYQGNIWVNSMPLSKWTSWSCLLWLHCLNLLQNIPCKKAKLQLLQLPNYGLNCFWNHLWNCLGMTIQLELSLELFKDDHTTRIVSKIVQGWSYKRLWQISHILVLQNSSSLELLFTCHYSAPSGDALSLVGNC